MENQEEFKVSGKEVKEKFKNLGREIGTRNIVIKNQQGGTVFVMPLYVGIIGIILVPIITGILALITLFNECSIAIVKK